jgi:hypothetical protein
VLSSTSLYWKRWALIQREGWICRSQGVHQGLGVQQARAVQRGQGVHRGQGVENGSGDPRLIIATNLLYGSAQPSSAEGTRTLGRRREGTMQATWSSHLTLRYKAMRITTASSDTMRMMTTNTRCDEDDDNKSPIR